MIDLEKLKAACDAVIADPTLQPIKDPATGNLLKTFCNLGAMVVADAMGCIELDDKMADDQYKVMNDNASGKWHKVEGTMAAGLAQQGALVFAAMTSAQLGDGHGHIAAVYPAVMVMSQKLNRLVPQVANVGVFNREEGENWAFPPADGEATYFSYDG